MRTENPRVPSQKKLENASSIPVNGAESMSMLVNHSGRLSTLDRLTLREIRDNDEPDYDQDYKKVRARIAREYDLEDDD